MFLEAQGLIVKDNIINKDNQSAIKLENNGRSSSGKRTRHINVRYFFVTDRIKQGDARIVYCHTDMLLADFYTKPLQGKQFRIFRNLILNLGDNYTSNHKLAEKIKKMKTSHIQPDKIIKCKTKFELQECVENKVMCTYKNVLLSRIKNGGINKVTSVLKTSKCRPYKGRKKI